MSGFGMIAGASSPVSSDAASSPNNLTKSGASSTRTTMGGAPITEPIAQQLAALPFISFYQTKPKPGEASFTMDEIFRLASRRMTLLHTLQEKQEQLSYSGGNPYAQAGDDGNNNTPFNMHSDRTTEMAAKLLGFSNLDSLLNSAKPRVEPDVNYDPGLIRQNMEDFVSHWACRLAFCQDSKWTEWFVRNEKILFREKLRVIFINMNQLLNNNRQQRLHGSGGIVGFGGAAVSGVSSPTAGADNNNNNNNVSSVDAAAASSSSTEDPIDAFLKLFPSSQAERLSSEFFGGATMMQDAFFDYLRVSSPQLNVDEKPDKFQGLYTVPFKAAKDLVKKRRCYVHKGRAVIQQSDLIDYITMHFQDAIRRSTRQALHTRRSIIEDTATVDASTSSKATLLSMLDSVFKNIVAEPVMDLQAVASNEGSITISDMQKPILAQQHMPPCMLMMDETVRREGHIKHNGRWQYGLFLKAAGLNMLDNIRFFAETMTQKGGGSYENFNKSAYGYGIRHMYGKEGKHVDYSALSCPSMINGGTPNLAADKVDCFGCPFKHLEEGPLRRTLGVKRIGRNVPTAGDIEAIVEDKKGMHFTRACRRYFSVLHGNVLHPDADSGQLFKSPVEFFTESRKLDREAQEKAAEEEKKGDNNGTTTTTDASDSRRRERESGGASGNTSASPASPSTTATK